MGRVGCHALSDHISSYSPLVYRNDDDELPPPHDPRTTSLHTSPPHHGPWAAGDRRRTATGDGLYVQQRLIRRTNDGQSKGDLLTRKEASREAVQQGMSLAERQQHRAAKAFFELSLVPSAHHAITSVADAYSSGPTASRRLPSTASTSRQALPRCHGIVAPPVELDYMNHDWLKRKGYAVRFATASVRRDPPGRRSRPGISARRRVSYDGLSGAGRSVNRDGHMERRSSDSSSNTSGVVMMEQLEMPHSMLLGGDDRLISESMGENPMHYVRTHKK